VESKRAWEEKNQELEDVKKSNSKATKALDKALKDIATCVSRLSLRSFPLSNLIFLDRILRTTKSNGYLPSVSRSTEDARWRKLIFHSRKVLWTTFLSKR